MANARFALALALNEIDETMSAVGNETTGAADQARNALESASNWLLHDAPRLELESVRLALTLAERAAWWDTVDRDMHGNGRRIEALMQVAQTVFDWDFVVGPTKRQIEKTEDAKFAAAQFAA